MIVSEVVCHYDGMAVGAIPVDECGHERESIVKQVKNSTFFLGRRSSKIQLACRAPYFRIRHRSKCGLLASGHRTPCDTAGLRFELSNEPEMRMITIATRVCKMAL